MNKNRPLIMAHKGGDCFGPENSAQAIRGSLAYQPDIFELDIRKSLDGILFCYHGAMLEFLFPRFFFRRTLSALKKRYPSIITLAEAARLIDEHCFQLFLDVKDRSITLPELREAIPQFRARPILVAANNIKWHTQLGPLPPPWKKVLNVGLVPLWPKVPKLRQAGLWLIELFWWQYTRKNISALRQLGYEVTLSHFLLPTPIYLRQAFAKKILFVFDDDLPRLIERKKQVTSA